MYYVVASTLFDINVIKCSKIIYIHFQIEIKIFASGRYFLIIALKQYCFPCLITLTR